MDLKAKEAYRRARERYPTIDLPYEEYVTCLEKSSLDPDKIRHEDLFLAQACFRGDRIAWEHFLDDYLPLLKRWAGQACRHLQESEDLVQDILAGLLEDKRKLAGYSGRGSLAGWLRVTISRAAIDRFRRRRPEVALEELTEKGREPAAPPAPPADEFDEHGGAQFARILDDEMRSLPARDRLLLGLYYLEGVPLKRIGRQFGVHESTVSRRLDRLRRNIRKRVEKQLRKQRQR